MRWLKYSILLFVVIACRNQDPPSSENKFGMFRAMFMGDPSQSVTIGWNYGQGELKDNVIYYDVIDHGQDISKYRFFKVSNVYNQYKQMNNAFVTLNHLTPQTRYYFVIRNSKELSQRYFFETLSDSSNTRLSLIAGGDSRNNRVPRQLANHLVSKLRADAVLFGGDMTDDGTTQEWLDWFEDWQLTISEDGRITPLIPARGNHEDSNEELIKLFHTNNNVYYATHFAGGLLKTITLNTESSIGGNQTQWLEAELSQGQEATWTIVQYHKPMRPHVRSKREGTRQYTHWAPLFYQYRVPLVIESDSHMVKRTYPIRPTSLDDPTISIDSEEGFVRDDENGTTYVGEGCWGAPLRKNNDNKNWTMASGSFNQFKWIFVDEEKIEVRTVQVDNALEVDSIDDGQDRFRAPLHLKTWNPPSGEVITIENK